MNLNNEDTNTNELRESVFNTLNLISELESPEPQQSIQSEIPNNVQTSTNVSVNENSFNIPPQGQEEEVRLSNTFISGIKDKMLDPSRLERIQNGTASEEEKIKYQMNNDFISMKETIESQSNTIKKLESDLSSLKDEMQNMSSVFQSKIMQLQNAANNVTANIVPTQTEQPQSVNQPINNVQQQPVEQQMVSQQMHQNQTMGQTQQMMHQPQMANQTMQQTQPQQPMQMNQQPAPQNVVECKEANPRVGNFNSDDVSIEKYFYCGNK